MTLTVNGVAIAVTDGWTVGDLVRSRSGEQRKVAVARNGEVVPRGDWESTALAANDVVELLAPVAGG